MLQKLLSQYAMPSLIIQGYYLSIVAAQSKPFRSAGYGVRVIVLLDVAPKKIRPQAPAKVCAKELIVRATYARATKIRRQRHGLGVPEDHDAIIILRGEQVKERSEIRRLIGRTSTSIPNALSWNKVVIFCRMRPALETLMDGATSKQHDCVGWVSYV